MKNLVSSVLGLFALLAASSAFADDGPSYFLQKNQLFTQSDGSGAVASSPYSYAFSVNSPLSVTKVTLPNSTQVTIPYRAGDGRNKLTQVFTSKAALDAAFPNGTYTFASPTVTMNMTTDLYPPATPAITGGGTWSNGVLVIDPAATTTITINPFTTYSSSSYVLGHMSIDLSPNNGTNQELSQEAVSIAAFGNPAAPAFSSFTIHPGDVAAGVIYEGEIDFDSVTTYDTTNQGVSLFSKQLRFLCGRKIGQPAGGADDHHPAHG